MGPNLLGHKKCSVLGQWNLDLERCSDSHVWGPPLRESLEHCWRLGKNYPKKKKSANIISQFGILSLSKKKNKNKNKKNRIHSLYPSSTINSFLNPPSSCKVLILLFLSKKKKKKFRTAFQLSWTTEMISRHQRQGSPSLSLSNHTH